MKNLQKINIRKICLICEGYEEYDYINRLINIGVFDNKYQILLINAKSMNNIIPRYQERYQSNSYDLVLIFCDTDKWPSTTYRDIKVKINEFHDNNVASDIIIFGNPCTMQIVLTHFGDVKLNASNKTSNGTQIYKLTGIKDYKAKDEQRKELFNKINKKTYNIMKKNIEKLSDKDTDISSTNILSFLKKLESDDDSWIEDINQKL